VYWNGHDMTGWGWFTMSVGMLVFWALLITVAALLYRNLNRTPDQPHTPDGTSPEQLLAERFARGDIDEEEYRRRLAVLRADGRPSLTKP
jgi:putative membrane protein